MQSELGEYDDDGFNGELPGFRKAQLKSPILSDDPSFADDSCPWCLHPADEFREHDNGIVGCSNCDAIIPVDAEWYKEGSKIVI